MAGLFWSKADLPRTLAVNSPSGLLNPSLAYGVPYDAQADPAAAAAIRGAFLGVVDERAGLPGPINEVRNPVGGLSNLGWNSYIGTGGTKTVTRITGDGPIAGVTTCLEYDMTNNSGANYAPEVQMCAAATVNARAVPGAQVYVGGWVKVVNAGGVTPAFVATCRVHDAADAWLANSSYGSTISCPVGTWTWVSAIVTVPSTAGATYASPQLVYTQLPTTGHVVFRASLATFVYRSTAPAWPILGDLPYNTWEGTAHASRSYHLV